jgi:hypothetical protein
VNYQISSNEDIVNLLKYDLLIEISKNKDIFNGNKLEDFIDLQNLCYLFANNNKSEILKNIALYIPKV